MDSETKIVTNSFVDPPGKKRYPCRPAPRQCKAKSKQSGVQCRRRASRGYDVCAIHGGKTPRGIAHHSYSNGAQSKFDYLPKDLKSKADRIYGSADLLKGRIPAARLESRLQELYDKLKTTESPDAWKAMISQAMDIKIAVNQLMQVINARTEDDLLKRDDHLKQIVSIAELMEKIVTGALGSMSVWEEIKRLEQLHMKIRDAESKRIMNAQTTLTMQEAQLLRQIFVKAIVEEVHDRQVRQRIAERIKAALPSPVAPGAFASPDPIDVEAEDVEEVESEEV